MDHQIIGIVANSTKHQAAAHVRTLRDGFLKGGARVLLEESAAVLTDSGSGVALAELGAAADVIVVLGGDGTLLRTARMLGPDTKPLAAVNIGRLGFLTTATETEIERFIEAILTKDYRLTQRGLIQATFHRQDGTVLTEGGMNEVTVTRGTLSRMLKLEVKIDGEFFNRYSSDGLIISTPTGSTAYSLSAGGPIINPVAGVFCLVPICPHALSIRSFIVNDNVNIEIIPVEPLDEVLLNVDGGAAWLLAKDRPIVLQKAPWTVPLISFRETSFYEILRKKLQWSGSSV